MKEIEAGRAEEAAREAAAAEQPDSILRYRLEIGVFDDDVRAAEELTRLIDAGYDASIVSGRAGDRVLYRIDVGPYATLEEAERVGQVLDAAFGLDADVVVERTEP